jgi:ribosomal protein S18 acetylase RimI-like enzyme
MGRIFGCGPSFDQGVQTVTDPKPLATLPDGVTLREATAGDIAEMMEVVNAAFEVESFFVDRPRTHAAQLAAQLRCGHFLLAHQGGQLLASVYYELRGEQRGYIGMLAVRPWHQRSGLGRAMMQAVEQLLRGAGCSIAEISVVNLRTALPPLYRKLGYAEAGVAEPPEELRQKLTVPVHLIRMEKQL